VNGAERTQGKPKGRLTRYKVTETTLVAFISTGQLNDVGPIVLGRSQAQFFLGRPFVGTAPNRIDILVA